MLEFWIACLGQKDGHTTKTIFLSTLDGSERASPCARRGCIVDADLRRCATGLLRFVPVAPKSAGLTAGDTSGDRAAKLIPGD